MAGQGSQKVGKRREEIGKSKEKTGERGFKDSRVKVNRS